MFRRLCPFLLGVLAACGTAVPGGSDAGSIPTLPTPAGPDRVLASPTDDQARAFRAGDTAFEQVFTEFDGLGPVYVRPSCESCHLHAGRGPGTTERMALVVEATGAPGDPLPYGPLVRSLLTAGARTPVLPPEGGLPPGQVLVVSARVPPAAFGRAYLEAIDEAEVERVEAEQASDTDGVRGRIHRVPFRSTRSIDPRYPVHLQGENGLLGRFGVKATLATLDEVVADALQEDMGLTTRMRPAELPNPDGLGDDLVPGVDLPDLQLSAAVAYVRLLDLPPRAAPDPVGAALFGTVGCAVCHVPALRTRADWPMPQLASIAGPVFTDLLLHQMGPDLADGQADEGAAPGEFRTAPLIGLHFLPSYLHDGRASTVEAAILGHGGPGSEAGVAVGRFTALSSADRATLLAYVSSL